MYIPRRMNITDHPDLSHELVKIEKGVRENAYLDTYVRKADQPPAFFPIEANSTTPTRAIWVETSGGPPLENVCA